MARFLSSNESLEEDIGCRKSLVHNFNPLLQKRECHRNSENYIKLMFTVYYQVDLGTDARHCFCKASELLAVVE